MVYNFANLVEHTQGGSKKVQWDGGFLVNTYDLDNSPEEFGLAHFISGVVPNGQHIGHIVVLNEDDYANVKDIQTWTTQPELSKAKYSFDLLDEGDKMMVKAHKYEKYTHRITKILEVVGAVSDTTTIDTDGFDINKICKTTQHCKDDAFCNNNKHCQAKRDYDSDCSENEQCLSTFCGATKSDASNDVCLFECGVNRAGGQTCDAHTANGYHYCNGDHHCNTGLYCSPSTDQCHTCLGSTINASHTKYYIKDVNSGKYMVMNGSGDDYKVDMEDFSNNNVDGQRWKIRVDSNGNLLLKNYGKGMIVRVHKDNSVRGRSGDEDNMHVTFVANGNACNEYKIKFTEWDDYLVKDGGRIRSTTNANEATIFRFERAD